VRATHAAARYLSDLHKIFNDWILAIAAYNCGPGNVSKAIRRAGGKTDFWKIYPFLPRETRGYVPAYIATTYLMNFYDKHNISPVAIDIPTYTDTVIVTKEIHLQQVSAVLDVPIEVLRTLNPQYKRDIVPAYKDPYPLLLPPIKAIQFVTLQDSIHNYNYSAYFTAMQVIDIDSQNDNPALNVARLKKNFHVVKKGETLASISKKYGISVNELKYLNKIKGRSVVPGRSIVVGFSPIDKKSVVTTSDSLTKMEVTPEKEVLVVQKSDGDSTHKSISKPQFRYYKVSSGDTIWSIAKKFPGVTHMDIINNNKLKDGHIIPGQVLKIPKI
jgi:membrane-bound lytic murein transglycosylase D